MTCLTSSFNGLDLPNHFLVRRFGGSAQSAFQIAPRYFSDLFSNIFYIGDSMIHFVLHDAKDTVAVVVVEGVKTGDALTGWIMDEDKMINLQARQDIPIGHKIALKDMATGDTVWKYGIDMGKVVAPIQVGQHAHVHNIKTKRW
jgi:(2R)-sulfolactate sulfo-lyase subunit alpha